MNKKIMAVVLTLVMVVSVCVGCGKKDSTYFKEVKEMTKITIGTAETEINFKGSGDMGEVPSMVLDAEGKMAVSVKVETTNESSNKAAAKFFAKVGQDSEYTEVTTMIVNDKKLYLSVDPIVEFVKRFDEDIATQLQTSLGSMGISGNVSIDMGQLMTALGTEYPEINDDMMKSSYEFTGELVTVLEKNFTELAGQEGDDYTLTITSEKAEIAVNGLINLCKNDAKGIIEKLQNVIKKVYGEDNEMYDSMKETFDELSNSTADVAKTIEDSKEDVVKAFKDYDLNIISKVSVNGSEGKREANISLESGDITAEGTTLNASIYSKIKEGKPSINEMIPEDASDLTTILIALMNQLQDTSSDTELY